MKKLITFITLLVCLVSSISAQYTRVDVKRLGRYIFTDEVGSLFTWIPTPQTNTGWTQGYFESREYLTPQDSGSFIIEPTGQIKISLKRANTEPKWEYDNNTLVSIFIEPTKSTFTRQGANVSGLKNNSNYTSANIYRLEYNQGQIKVYVDGVEVYHDTTTYTERIRLSGAFYEGSSSIFHKDFNFDDGKSFLIVGGGQSNWRGRGDNSLAPIIPYGWDFRPSTNTFTVATSPIGENSAFQQANTGAAVEKLLQEYSQLSDDTIYYVHAAIGGTALEVPGNSAAWNDADSVTQDLGDIMFYYANKASIVSGKPLKGVIWMQGETEASAASSPNEDKDSVKVVHTAKLNRHVDKGDYAMGKVPWALVYIPYHTQIDTNAHRAINLALDAVAAERENVFIASTSAPKLTKIDNIHLDQPSLNIVGKEVAQSLYMFLSGSSLPADTTGTLDPYIQLANYNINLKEFYVRDDSYVWITVYNMQGQVIVNNTGTYLSGTHSMNIDLSTLPSGIYTIRARIGDDIITQKYSFTSL